MASDHTSEFLVLIDRYLAGDVSAEEMVRIRELCEADGSFELEFVRALRFESLLTSTLREAGQSDFMPSQTDDEDEVFEAHPDFLFNYDDETAADASGIDLLHAGLLSEEDEAVLRIDTSGDRWLIDELRDADLLAEMLRDTFREIAGDGPAQTFVGADRIDRYLAGDLDAPDVAQLMADADESTTLGIELASARAFESMMRDGLDALADGKKVPESSDLQPTPWIGACDERLERLLAGDLGPEELLRLESAASNAQSLSIRLSETQRFENLISTTLGTVAMGTSARTPMAPRPSSMSNPRARRIREHAALSRKRDRTRRRAWTVSSLFSALIIVAAIYGLWPSNDGTLPAQDEPVALISTGDERGTTTSVVDADSPKPSTVEGQEQRSPEGAKAPLPESVKEGDTPEHATSTTTNEAQPLPRQIEPVEVKDEGKGRVILPKDPSIKKEGDPAGSNDPRPEKVANPKKDTTKVKDSTSTDRPDDPWFKKIELSLSPSQAAESLIHSGDMATELEAILDDNGDFTAATLKLLSQKHYKNQRWPSKVRNLPATLALVLRSLMQRKLLEGNWRKDRKEFTNGIEAMLNRYRNEVANSEISPWDTAEVLTTLVLWHRVDGKSKRLLSKMKASHRKIVADGIKALVKSQKDNGLWGEVNASAYGEVGSIGTLAHRAGKEVESDLFNTFAVMRALQAGTNLLKSSVSSRVYQSALEAILKSQSTTGEKVSLRRLELDAKGELVGSEFAALARGWTLTGDLMNAETGRLLPRSGAATAAALFTLKFASKQLSKSQLAKIEESFGEGSIAIAERDAVAWLEEHHRNDANPVADGESKLTHYINFRYFYLYAIRKAYAETGDLLLLKKSAHQTLTGNVLGSSSKLSKSSARETMKRGVINWPIRRALSLLSLYAE